MNLAEVQAIGRTYQREGFSDMYAEAIPLLHRHYREIAHFQDIPLEVDVERYKVMEANGLLRIYTVRTGPQAALVGYASFVVMPNPHYCSSLQAVQDVLYVQPELRGYMVGPRLIRFCEDELRKEGVQAIYHHAKTRHPELGLMLERMGYEPVDIVYAKRMDGG